MAITTSFKMVSEIFAHQPPQNWKSIDEFEQYYLRRIQEKLSDTNYYTNREGVEITIEPINHFPELKMYEVWSEGFNIQGNSSGAVLLGKALARNFAQACDIVMCKNHLAWIERVNSPDYKEYCPASTWGYNPNELSDWGCGLYWSEELARKNLG